MASLPGGRAGQNQGNPARQYLLKKISARPRTIRRAPAILHLPISTVILFPNWCNGVVRGLAMELWLSEEQRGFFGVCYIPPCEQTLVENSRPGTVLDACRIVPAYVLLGLLKHLVPLRWLAKWTWCETTGPRDRLAERRLTANVLRLSKLLRIADRDCL